MKSQNINQIFKKRLFARLPDSLRANSNFQSINASEGLSFSQSDKRVLVKEAIFWTTSLSLFAITSSILYYSYRWNKERFKAMREGRDLDEWAQDFEQNDSMAQFVKKLSQIGKPERQIK